MRFCKAKSCRLLVIEVADPRAVSSNRKEMRMGRRQATSSEPRVRKGKVQGGRVNSSLGEKLTLISSHTVLPVSGINIIPVYRVCVHVSMCPCVSVLVQSPHVSKAGQEAPGITCF